METEIIQNNNSMIFDDIFCYEYYMNIGFITINFRNF